MAFRKSGLEIIDLDLPLNPPRHLRYGQSWLVADVQWSPFAARENWVASASNQKTLIWNLTMSENSRHGAIEHTLHAHSRAITDINFSAHQADIIATCAVDGYIHCWDLRRPRKPAMTFVDWDSGATQVKWNRQDQHIIASSHDRWLRIWDDRNGAYPLESIQAHESKIYGIDWNRTMHTKIATCSLDKSIKFWDYTNGPEDRLERVIRTDFPVWRARHTPFGTGLLAMPQNSSGDLYLYDRREESRSADEKPPAVAVFKGHGDKQVKEFLWRTRGDVSQEGIDNRDFQLVSWGTDHQLRLQHAEAEQLKTVGYVKGAPVDKLLKITRKGATYRTFRHLDYVGNDKDKQKPLRVYEAESLLQPGVSVDAAKHMTFTKTSPYGSHDRRLTRPSTDKRKQLNWMSGIKFNTPLVTTRQRSARQLSLIGGEEEWDAPETLHDEIIRVSKQYSKVNFDDINMDKRTVAVSMDGPWGQSGDPTYIKVHIKFPDQYPELKAPVFTIHRSSLVPEVVYEKIHDGIKQIASGYMQRKRGCLEAAVCYLLGELSLEESTTLWLMENTGIDDVRGIDDLVDDSSSEDEGDIPMTLSVTMSQELAASTSDGTLAASTGNPNAVPVPSSCGARFSSNGKLVCFFPPKQEKLKSLLGQIQPDSDKSREEPSFNSIGRLRTEIGSTRSRMSPLADGEEDESSETSDDSDGSSSSSDSGSSRFRLGLSSFWKRPGVRRNLSTRGSQKSSTIGTGTGTGTAFSRARVQKPRNTVVLHDVEQFVPAKRMLASEYIVFNDGDCGSVCNHNAEVAQRHGYQDLADIWRYAAMLLDHDVPLEVSEQSYRQEPILVIAKTMLRRCRRNSAYDSGVDLSFDKKPRSDVKARVKWGDNPLAKPLIEDLFNHFARLADIQMLAMLSCVFSEPSTEYGTSQAEMRASQAETPLSMKTPGFSLDYFPTDIAAWSVYQKGPYSTAASTPKALTPTAAYGSYGSSVGLSFPSEHASATYSTENTPPIRSARGSSEKLSHIAQQTASLSTSPEDKRHFKRGNSGLSTFSFSRTFSATAPSSPPSRKKSSPVEQLLGTLTPNAVTWGHNTVFGVTKDIHSTTLQHHNNSAEGYQSNEDDSRAPTGIDFRLHNVDLFDDEGLFSTPLLASSSHHSLFASYRSAYAELLFAWGLQLARLEVLKISGLPDYFSAVNAARTVGMSPNNGGNFAASVKSNDAKTVIHDGGPPSPIMLGKKGSIDKTSPNGQGLDVVAYCLKHELLLTPLPPPSNGILPLGGAPGSCERCARQQRQLKCVVCLESVSAILAPCLTCGCVSHEQCLREYQLQPEYDGTCAGGCECICRKEAAGKKVAVESWEVMMGAIELERMRNLHNDSRRATNDTLQTPDSEHELDWETLEGSHGLRKAENGQSTSGRSTPVQTGAALAYGHWRRGLEGMRATGPEWGKRKATLLRDI